jgi:uncharacterized protein YqeY
MKTRLKEDLQKARVGKQLVRGSLLALLVGEIQLVENRVDKNGKRETVTDETITAIIKKFRKGAEEMLSYGDKRAELEIEILNEYLEDEMSVDQVIAVINEQVSLRCDIVNASNAMRYIKTVKDLTGADGGVAKEAVMKIHADG